MLNFILKDSPEGGTFSAQWGETYRGDGDTYTIAANIGLPLGSRGFVNLSGEFGETDATVRSVQRDDAATLIAAGNMAVPDPAQIWGQQNVNEDFKFFANMGLDVTDSIELYAFGNYAGRNFDRGRWRPVEADRRLQTYRRLARKSSSTSMATNQFTMTNGAAMRDGRRSACLSAFSSSVEPGSCS